MITGALTKMSNQLAADNRAHYQLLIGDQQIALNPLLGQSLSLKFAGKIACVGCGRVISKSFQQGYCFPCTQRLAACDLCILKPELCHFAKGTCREPEWALGHCMQPHYVYLANSSGLKVGITRETNVPYRWIDQGATQALLIAKTNSRYVSGLVEVMFKQYVADKTNWRKMLQGDAEPLDLVMIRDQWLPQIMPAIDALRQQNQSAVIDLLPEQTPYQIHYPVLHYPNKVVSLDLAQMTEMSGVLHGIKAQYLLFDKGVINVRKFSGYHVELEV